MWSHGMKIDEWTWCNPKASHPTVSYSNIMAHMYVQAISTIFLKMSTKKMLRFTHFYTMPCTLTSYQSFFSGNIIQYFLNLLPSWEEEKGNESLKKKAKSIQKAIQGVTTLNFFNNSYKTFKNPLKHFHHIFNISLKFSLPSNVTLIFPPRQSTYGKCFSYTETDNTFSSDGERKINVTHIHCEHFMLMIYCF